jgi:hypothetical protein
MSTGVHAQFDLVYTATQDHARQRVAGNLFIVAANRSYRAVSGSRQLSPLPTGTYLCQNLRLRSFRDDPSGAMQRNRPAQSRWVVDPGVGGACLPGWSVDLEPLFATSRTLLRIHPDGNLPGTEGCIGVINDVEACYQDLRRLLDRNTSALLLVNHNNFAAVR